MSRAPAIALVIAVATLVLTLYGCGSHGDAKITTTRTTTTTTSSAPPIARLSATLDDQVDGLETRVVFSPDARLLAVWSRLKSKKIYIYDMTVSPPALNATIESSEDEKMTLQSVAFSADSRRIAVGGAAASSNGTYLSRVHIYDLSAQPPWVEASLDGAGGLYTVLRGVPLAFSGNTHWLAVGIAELTNDGNIVARTQIYDGEVLELNATLDNSGLESVVFSGDSRWLAAGGTDNATVHVFDMTVSPPALNASLGTGYCKADALAFAADSRWLVIGCDGSVDIYDMAVRPPALNQSLPLKANSVMLSHDSRWLAVANDYDPQQHAVYVYDLTRNMHEAALDDAGIRADSVAFSADSRWLAVGEDRKTYVYEMLGRS